MKKQTELPTPGKSNSSSYVHTSRQLLDTSAASVVSAGVASSTDSADNYLQDVMFSQNTVSPILGGRFSSMLVPMFYCNLVWMRNNCSVSLLSFRLRVLEMNSLLHHFFSFFSFFFSLYIYMRICIFIWN